MFYYCSPTHAAAASSALARGARLLTHTHTKKTRMHTQYGNTGARRALICCNKHSAGLALFGAVAPPEKTATTAHGTWPAKQTSHSNTRARAHAHTHALKQRRRARAPRARGEETYLRSLGQGGGQKVRSRERAAQGESRYRGRRGRAARPQQSAQRASPFAIPYHTYPHALC